MRKPWKPLTILFLQLAVVITGLVMLLTGYVPTNGFGRPQHELVWGIDIGFMAGLGVAFIIAAWPR